MTAEASRRSLHTVVKTPMGRVLLRLPCRGLGPGWSLLARTSGALNPLQPPSLLPSWLLFRKGITSHSCESLRAWWGMQVCVIASLL